MRENGFVPAVVDSRAGEDIRERGFTRRHLQVDFDVARALGELAHAAWSLPKDQYYHGGDRFRSLNRFRAELVEGGVNMLPCDDGQPYVQSEKYNAVLGGKLRKYAPLPLEIADSPGVSAPVSGWRELPGKYACSQIRGESLSSLRHQPARPAQGW